MPERWLSMDEIAANPGGQSRHDLQADHLEGLTRIESRSALEIHGLRSGQLDSNRQSSEGESP